MRTVAWLGLVIAVSGCEPPRPATDACPTDPKMGESLGCAVFHALAGEDEAAYVRLVLTAPHDLAASSLVDQPPDPGTHEDEIRRREAAADDFHTMLEELRVREIAPVSMQLDGIDLVQAARRGDVGFAEEIVVRARAGKKKIAITIDDCFFVNGRWLVGDGLRIRP